MSPDCGAVGIGRGQGRATRDLQGDKQLRCPSRRGRPPERRSRGSSVPLKQEFGERLQRDGLSAKRLQGRKRAVGELLRDFARLCKANDRRIGRLLGFGVLASGLAQLFSRLCDVENVVDYLERQSDVVTKIAE